MTDPTPKRLWLCTTYSGAIAIAVANDEAEARDQLHDVLVDQATDINDVFQPVQMQELNMSIPFARLLHDPA